MKIIPSKDNFLQPTLSDQIEAEGFVARERSIALLEDAVCTKLSSSSLPGATPIESQQAFSGGFDGELVQMTGRVVDYSRDQEQVHLFVDTGSLVVEALGNWPSQPGEQQEWQRDTKACVTGIHEATYGPTYVYNKL